MPHYRVVAAIIQHQGNIRCVQKGAGKHPYMRYKYEFPGGKVEPGESAHTALHREVREELHLDIEVNGWYHTVSHQYPDFSITMEAYRCTAIDTDSLLLTEHIHHLWLPVAELTQLDWAAADLPIVAKLTSEDKLA